MSSAFVAPATTASHAVTQIYLLPLIILRTTLFGLIAFVVQTLAFVLFPFAAIGYGGYCLIRRLTNGPRT